MLPDQKRASNGAVLDTDNRASRLNLFQRRSVVAVDADFDASARSKNEHDSSDEENKYVVELFGVWSKIDTDDLSAWVGVRVTGGRRTKRTKKKEHKEHWIERKQKEHCTCEWSVSMSFLLWRRKKRRMDKEEERKKEQWRRGKKKKGLMDMPLSDGFWVLKTSFSCFYFWWLSSIFESPSNKNHNPKLIQTNHHLWNPYDLDDGNRRLSDITQNLSHPNKLLATSILYNKKSGV